MRLARRTLVLAALVLVTSIAAATPPERTDLAAPTVEIPVDLSRRFLAVEVMVNGRGPYWFNVDTYASVHACIDRGLARELGLPKRGRVRNSDGAGNARLRDLAGIRRLTVGGATFEGVTALVDDYTWVEGPGDAPVRGLLGFELFEDLLLTIDYPAERLELSRGKLSWDDPKVEQYRAPHGAPDVRITIGGRAMDVGIDTGSRSSLHVGRRDAAPLKLADTPTAAGTARTSYGSSTVHQARLADALVFGGEPRERVPILVSDGLMHPMIGYGLLWDCRLAFDQRRRLVRVERAPRKASPIALAPDALDRYVGTYRFGGDAVLTVRRAGEHLLVRQNERADSEAFPVAPHEFAFREMPARLRFETDDEGRIAHVVVIDGHADAEHRGARVK